MSWVSYWMGDQPKYIGVGQAHGRYNPANVQVSI